MKSNKKVYVANAGRYASMPFRYVGKSGLQLPVISLGLWQNFGEGQDLETAIDLVCGAFDRGVTHFDLANNYGPPPGMAETQFGKILANQLAPYRDEIIVTSKAGFLMYDGPYGEFGSRKYLMASCNQSLKRLGLDYVDIFYSHRYDPNTPLEETMGVLADIVRSGKAIYAGISNYPAGATRQACAILRDMGVPAIANQVSYSIINRWTEEDGVIDACQDEGLGIIAFSPLSQGVLSGKYSTTGGDGKTRANAPGSTLRLERFGDELLKGVGGLHEIAEARGQSMTQLALSWVIGRPGVTTALIGARTLDQLTENLGAIDNLQMSAQEYAAIDRIIGGHRFNVYPRMPDVIRDSV